MAVRPTYKKHTADRLRDLAELESTTVSHAASPDGRVRLRESEDPDTALTGIPGMYRALLAHIKRGGHTG